VQPRRRWLLIGIAVLLVVVTVLLTDRCYVEQHRFVVLGAGLGWLLALMLSTKVIRIVLLVAALAVPFFYRHSEFTPSAEAGAISTLREAAATVNDFRRSHPAEGYPPHSPPIVPNCRARNVYEFRYNRAWSSSSTPSDRFVLVAVPLGSSKTRGLRSFAIAEDGHIYATSPNSGRAANRTDEPIQ
jgi:hypothetical protein